MSLIKLKIKTNNQKYPIFIGDNILDKIKKLLKENAIKFNQCLIIVDKNVPKKLINKVIKSLPSKKITIHHFVASELNKNQESIDKVSELNRSIVSTLGLRGDTSRPNLWRDIRSIIFSLLDGSKMPSIYSELSQKIILNSTSSDVNRDSPYGDL